MTTGQRIKKRRKELNISAEEIAKALHLSPATIYRYEKGDIEKVPGDILEPLAKILDTTPAYLMGWEESEPLILSNIDGIVPVPHGKAVPIIGSIACGTPVLAVENIDGYIEANPQDPADFALICKGSSMRPRLIDGDVVLIHQQPTVDNGQTAAVLIGEEATLKRVYFPDREHIILSPENPDFSPMSFAKEELNNIKILGKVVGFVRYF